MLLRTPSFSRSLFAAAVSTALFVSAGASAQQAPQAQGSEVAPSLRAGTPAPDMLATLQGKYKGTTFRSVVTSHVPGIYEVTMGQNVAYTDASARYFFFGRLFDMQAQQDLTAEKLDSASKIDTKVLKTGDAIKLVKGNGARTLYVFSDPDCPFCKQLENNLVSLNNVTIYTFLMPLDGLHPDARGKAEAVWCSTDRAQSWDTLMKTGVAPTGSAKCDTPIDRNLALASSLSITGTPTLISADGRKMPGARSADQISSWLDAGPVAQGPSTQGSSKQ